MVDQPDDSKHRGRVKLRNRIKSIESVLIKLRVFDSKFGKSNDGIVKATRVGPIRSGVIGLVVAFVIDLILSQQGTVTLTLMVAYSMVGLGTGVAIGWSGLPAFGQGAFVAIGAYGAGIVRNSSLNPLVVIIVCAAAAAAVACLFAMLTVRLQFITFAILSFIFALALYQFLYTWGPLGAENGLPGIVPGSIFGISLSNANNLLGFCILVFSVVLVLLRWLYLSQSGRKIRAVRDNRMRAATLGVNVPWSQVLGYTVGAAVCAIGGVFYAYAVSVADPSLTYWTASTFAIIMVLIGGVTSFAGPALGGALIELAIIKTQSSAFTEDVVFGLILLVVALIAPEGLARLGWLSGKYMSHVQKPTRGTMEEKYQGGEPAAQEVKR